MRAALIILAILGFSVAGCGTCSDMVGGSIDDKVFYRGVRGDVEAIKQGDAATAVFYSVDLPFSAVADTVLVPVLIPVWLSTPDQNSIAASREKAKREAFVPPPENQPAPAPRP